jgi:uncharacterized membrane protein (Fun14 family)
MSIVRLGMIFIDGLIDGYCSLKELSSVILVLVGKYDISSTKKTVCNSIGDFFNITDSLILSVIKQWQ